MKIALIHYSYTPVIGGVETVVAAHGRLFAEDGHDVLVLCRRGEGGDPKVRLQRVPEDTAALRTLLADREVVFIHNVMTMPFDMALTESLWTLAGEMPGVRFVAWVHDVAACNPDYKLDEAMQVRLSAAHPKMEYVAVSELRARQWRQCSGSKSRIIPNGIDPARVMGLTSRVAEFVEKYALFGKMVLLHPTRILRRKNIELGLAVAAAIKGCAYIVTGAPDPHNAESSRYAAELLALRDSLGVQSRAIFLHEYFTPDDADMASLYRLADGLFFPSRQEGFGLPLLEAALHRLPAFCTDIEPLNELPATVRFPPDAEVADVAERIWTTLKASSALHARKEVLRRYAWQAVHRNYLAPLLAGKETPHHP